jgi:hypothetical protein
MKMASEYKPDSKLVNTPVDYLCGDPKTMTGGGVENGGVEFEGGGGEKESGGVFQTVTFETDVTNKK